ncbi:DUF6283 family protein [Streptomyces sp. NPDC051546]|uniref:DUF6283 family protein n=1 Tax=Streptomyces sp. NPDC051546 TaxID=3365655 RepID=UPI00379FA497
MTDGVREGRIEAGEELAHRKAPCNECPWRKDAPLGRFSLTRFEEMRSTSTQPDVHDHAAMVRAAVGEQELFGCHKGDPATGADLACAGWLAVEGQQNLAVRMDIVFGRLPGDVLSPRDGWPELYESYDAMVEAQSKGSGEEA